MGTGTNLVGKSPRETAMNELAWTADWAITLLRHLRMAYMTVWHTSNMAGPDYDYGESGPDKATVDSMVVSLRGLLTAIDKKFDMHLVMDDDGFPVWKNLENNLDEMKKQGQGIIPIPVSDAVPDVQAKKQPNSVARGMFRDYIMKLMDIQTGMQKLLNEHIDVMNPNFPTLGIEVKMVNRHGNEVRTNIFGDVNEFVKDELIRRHNQNKKPEQTDTVPQEWSPGEPPKIPSKKKEKK